MSSKANKKATKSKKPQSKSKSEANTKDKKKQSAKGPAKQNTKSPAKQGAKSPSKQAAKSSAKKGAKSSSKSANKTPKSATLMAYERQKKFEDTVPLGGAISQLTSELPILNKSLDAPDKRPWKKVKLPRFSMDMAGKRLLIVFASALVILAIAIAVIARVFTVETVTIEGNTHYTNEEIYEMVMGDKLGRNSIYLSMKYKNKDIEGIPFIQTMNVHIVNPSTIKITVYEKAMAGFVEYMGRYFYFDKDGTVVESSDVKTGGIPQVMGLNFDHIILYEKLPVESDEIFKQILEITQLLSKYGVEMDKIYFDANYNMTLYYDQARIKIGDFTAIDEKIIRLKDILPELKGRKGVLRLDNYNGSDSIITFEVDDDAVNAVLDEADQNDGESE